MNFCNCEGEAKNLNSFNDIYVTKYTYIFFLFGCCGVHEVRPLKSLLLKMTFVVQEFLWCYFYNFNRFDNLYLHSVCLAIRFLKQNLVFSATVFLACRIFCIEVKSLKPKTNNHKKWTGECSFFSKFAPSTSTHYIFLTRVVFDIWFFAPKTSSFFDDNNRKRYFCCFWFFDFWLPLRSA